MVHRDVKPQNALVVGSGEPLLTDFGLAARQDSGAERLTQEGTAMGTPAYMAPEQGEGRGTAASDQYSLGCSLFEMLTGQTPFAGPPAQQLFLHKTQPSPSPRSLRSEISRDLETVCRKTLEKELAARYPSCGELAEDLRRWLDGEVVRARRIGSAERLVRWARRNQYLAAASGFAATALTAALVLAITFVVFQQEANSQIFKANTDLSKANSQITKTNESLNETNQQLKQTDLKRVAALRQAGGLALNQGLSFARDQGDVRSGLLWLTHALELIPPDDREMQYVIRANLNAWRRQLSPLKMTFPRVNNWVVPAALSPDGRTVLGGGMEDGVRPYDTLSGEPCGPTLQHGQGQEPIGVIVFSPDGRTLLTGSRGPAMYQGGKEQSGDGEMRIWKTQTFELIAKKTFPGGVVQAAFRSDGEVVVTAGSDNQARLWEVATGKELGAPMPNLLGFAPQHLDALYHPGLVPGPPMPTPAGFAPLFSPNGNRLLLRPTSGAVRVHDDKSGKPLTSLLEHGQDLTCATFGGGGAEVWTGGNNKIRGWDAATGKELGKPMYADGTAHAFSPGGFAVLTGNSKGAWIGEPGGTYPHRLKFRFPIATYCFSKDGRLLLIGGGDENATESNSTLAQDGEAQVIDVETGRPVGRPMTHTFAVRTAAFSDDNRSVATGTGVAQVHVPFITDENGKQIKPGSGGELRVWEVAAGDPQPGRAWVLNGTFDNSGKALLDRDLAKTLAIQSGAFVGPKSCQLFNAATGAAVGGKLSFSDGWPTPRKDEAPGFGPKVSCFWSAPDGRSVAVCTEHTFFDQQKEIDFGKISKFKSRTTTVLWRWKDGRLEGTGRPLPDGATAVGFSRDGQRCLVLTAQTAQWWNVSTCSPVGSVVPLPPLADPTRPIYSAGIRVAFLSPDDRTLVLGEKRENIQFVQKFTPKVHMFDLDAGKAVGAPIPHPQGVTDAAFSPDGRFVLIGTNGENARLWDTKTCEGASPALLHGSAVDSVAFSPDGRLVATEGGGKVKVWHLPSGQAIGPALSADGRVVFSPDGKKIRLLWVGGHDKQLWPQKNSPVRKATEWDLMNPVDLPVPLLIQATQVLAEMEFSPGGLIRRLENEEWKARRVKLTSAEAADPLLAAFDHSQTPEAIWQAGLAARFEKMQDWITAVRHLDKALAARPNDASLLRRRGLAHSKLGRPDEAAADLVKAVALDPQEAEAWAALGDILARREQWGKAEFNLRKAVALQPHNALWGYQLGVVLLAGGDEAGYRKECLRMLHQFGTSQVLSELDDVAFLAVLRAGSTDRPADLSR